MDGYKTGAQRRAARRATDIAYTALCLIMIAGSILAIWNPAAFGFCFPIVFFAAAAACILTAVLRLRVVGSGRRPAAAFGILLAGLVLLGIAVVSLLTVGGAG